MSTTSRLDLGGKTLAVLISLTLALSLVLIGASPTTAQAATSYTGAWEGNDNPTPLQADEDPSGTEPLSGEANADSWLPKSYAWPYPWSRNAEATGNWIADSYGLTPADAALFEPVTVDRLADVLSVEDGRYYVVFATPRSKAGQKLIKAANDAAKAANTTTAGSVKKIYVFNPVIDDYQIDITLTAGIGNWSGGNSHTVKGTWTYIKSLLANGGAVEGTGSAKGDNVFDFDAYTPQTAVIFSTTQNTTGADDADALNEQRTISAAASADASSADSYTKAAPVDTTLVNDITDVFKNGTASYVPDSAVRTDFDFARRFWNAGVNDFNYNGGKATDAKFGRNDLNIFPTADEYNLLSAIEKTNVGTYTAANFPLEFVDFVEGFNRLNASLNSKSWLNYFFATIGCHNSQAYIGEFAKKGVKYNQKVYINDDTLDGSFRFGTTVGTKDAKNTASNQGSTANGWLGARNSGYKFSYLYGHSIEYLGDKVISKNETYKGNAIQYSYNGDTANTAAQTKARSNFTGSAPNNYDAAALAAAPAGNAVRLQIPFAYSFNGATALTATGYAPVTHETQFLHRKVTDDGRYSEYMMELTSVWGSPESVAATTTQTTDEVDGYATGASAAPGGASAYAQEGRDYPLESVFLHSRVAEPTDLYFNAPTPEISGTVKAGETVYLKTAGWPQPRADGATTVLAAAWELDGVAVKSGPVNATNGVFVIPADAAGKKLTLSITGTSSVTNPYYTLGATKTSAVATVAQVVTPKGNTLKTLKTATPKITGKTKVGKKLAVKVGSWTKGTKLTYQWYANGKAIKKATKTTFKLTKAQKGKKISVKVTGKKTGYKTAAKTSKKTAKVKK